VSTGGIVKTVFVVGAGPAGLFAANKLAQAGHQVIILNRDIKPGGLAEYGIYPVKEKMKSGLRKQFAKILSQPNVHYLGNVPVGAKYSVPLEMLAEFGPTATVFAVGAQGTKKLGLPGEGAKGVYSAKDFVYHYNLLPPFSQMDFSTGKRIAIVGMGNVMVDIARWLLLDDPERQTEEVYVVARRGPFEAKFDQKEFDYIEGHLDREDFQQELERVKERVAAVGQDISKLAEATFPVLAKPDTGVQKPLLRFRFLSSPSEIIPGAGGRIERLVLTENLLVERNGGTAARATDRSFELDVDTMIFAIGDSADPGVGLPFASGAYVTNPAPDASESAPYEVFDPATGKIVEATYVVGWARKASEGLVGIARQDAERGAAQVLKFLEGAKEKRGAAPQDILRALERRGLRIVDKEDLGFLGRAEEKQAQERGVPSFKFGDNDRMLAAIEEEKSRAGLPTAAN
jgi:ferredoxin--NADP+ reductase